MCSSYTCLGDNGVSVYTLPSFSKKYLFLNPSCLAFLSNCQSLLNNKCVTYIETTSHKTSSLYLPIKSVTNTCLFTLTTLSNQSYTSNSSITTTINNPIPYLILDLTSSMENILPIMCIFNIAIIHKWWHIITIRCLNSKFNLSIIPQNHDYLICTFWCIVPQSLTLKNLISRLCFICTLVLDFLFSGQNLLLWVARFNNFRSHYWLWWCITLSPIIHLST